MKPDRNIEKLIEAHAVGDISDAERELLQSYLDSGGEDAAMISEVMAFEEALNSRMALEEFEDDVAGAVLERVYRRPTDRQNFQDGLASGILEKAQAAGELHDFDRGSTSSLTIVLRAAAVVLVLAGVYAWFFQDLFDPIVPPAGSGLTQAVVDDIGDVAYGRVSKGSPLRPVLPEDTAPQARVLADQPLETEDGESALVRLTRGATLAVLPNTRLLIRRGQTNHTYAIRIQRGGFQVVNGGQGKRPIYVLTPQGFKGMIRGKGEVHLVSYALGAPRSVSTPSVEHSVVVRTEAGSRAEFSNDRETLDLETDQLGIISRSSAVKLTSVRDDKFAGVSVPGAISADMVQRGSEPAITIDGHVYTRMHVANEVLRVYAADLFELIARGLAVQVELSRLRLKVLPEVIQDAREFANREDLMRVVPLRSQAALEERASQVAGLITLAQDSKGRQSMVARRDMAAVCDFQWRRLARDVGLEFFPEAGVALRVSFRGRQQDITLQHAWHELQRYMRVTEMDRVLDDLVDRHVLKRELAARKITWPETGWDQKVPPALRLAQQLMVRMSGLTMRQYWDRLSIQKVLLSHADEPQSAAVDQYLQDRWPRKHEVVMEHYFFPFTDPSQGFPLENPEASRADARKEALAALHQLRTLGHFPTPPRSEERSGIWSPRVAESGPCTWWNEIFGREFTAAVVGLAQGEVSEPIDGPEGFHVMRAIRVNSLKVDPVDARRMARVALRLENGRIRLDRKIEASDCTFVGASSILR